MERDRQARLAALSLVVVFVLCSLAAGQIRGLNLPLADGYNLALLPDSPSMFESASFESTYNESESDSSTFTPLESTFESSGASQVQVAPSFSGRPDFHSPLTPGLRLQILERRAYSTSFLGGTFLDAVQAQFHNGSPGFGRGVQGLARRYGTMIADRDAAGFFGTFLFPSLLHQDARYVRLGAGSSAWRRAAYAASRTVLSRNEAGMTTINGSLLLTILATQTLKNVYYPAPYRGIGMTIDRTRDALLANAQNNLTREFLPDIEKFLWKHAPARVKRLEGRIPLRNYWEPRTFSETY